MSTSKPLSLNGLVPPVDFPATDFEAVQAKLTPHSVHSAHTHFISAWSAISYRYKAVAEHDQQFTASIGTHGPGAGGPIRYEQERDLFEFFSSGVSVFDAFCFGAFAIGALTGSTDFPIITEKDQRNVNWKNLLEAYIKSFASHPIVSVLDGVDRYCTYSNSKCPEYPDTPCGTGSTVRYQNWFHNDADRAYRQTQFDAR